jgi:hypoxanthine phosphoribosyltransferase
MIKKHYYSWQDVERMCVSIVNQMYKDNWKPDYIVGITRGGNVPATIISNMTGIRCEALKVSLRDDDSESESNCWMAEDAFGYEHFKILEHNADISASAGKPIVNLPISRKNILIVDDINDTGATFNWIEQDWPASCLPNEESWNTVWNNNVRFATLTENLASEFDKVRYTCHEINKAEEDVWLVYPWENIAEY